MIHFFFTHDLLLSYNGLGTVGLLMCWLPILLYNDMDLTVILKKSCVTLILRPEWISELILLLVNCVEFLAFDLACPGSQKLEVS